MTVVASDSFNRPDGPIGTADTGQVWQFMNSGRPQIASGRVPGLSCVAVIDSGTPNGLIRIRMAVARDDTSIYFRVVDNNNVLRLRPSGTQLLLQKKVASAATTMATYSGLAFADGDTIAVAPDGDGIIAYHNDVELIPDGATDPVVTIPDFATSTLHGFGSLGTAGAWDDFSVDDAVPGGGGTTTIDASAASVGGSAATASAQLVHSTRAAGAASVGKASTTAHAALVQSVIAASASSAGQTTTTAHAVLVTPGPSAASQGRTTMTARATLVLPVPLAASASSAGDSAATAHAALVARMLAASAASQGRTIVTAHAIRVAPVGQKPPHHIGAVRDPLALRIGTVTDPLVLHLGVVRDPLKLRVGTVRDGITGAPV